MNKISSKYANLKYMIKKHTIAQTFINFKKLLNHHTYTIHYGNSIAQSTAARLNSSKK